MRLSRQHIVLLGVLLIIITVVAVITWRVQRSTPEVATPAFEQHFASSTSTPASYKTVTGEVIAPTLSTSTFTVVTSWASWSPYTPTEFAVLAGLRAQYSPEELDIILLNRRETPEQADSYLKVNPAPEGVTLMIDEQDTFYSQIEGYTMPETVVYDQNGEVVLHLRGPVSHEQIAQLFAVD